MRAEVISHMVPRLERFLNRHILGMAPHPEEWPRPRHFAQLPVPAGIDQSDETGSAWILAHQYTTAWPHRRTPLGATGYRFAHNGDLDSGWHLAEVAAHFIRERISPDIDRLTLVPPAPVYRGESILPWLMRRLADLLGTRCTLQLFEPVCPYAAHPDVASYLAVPATSVFELNPKTDTPLDGQTVLLVDWMWHRGRTIRSLARQLRRKGAAVIRFAWFD